MITSTNINNKKFIFFGILILVAIIVFILVRYVFVSPQEKIRRELRRLEDMPVMSKEDYDNSEEIQKKQSLEQTREELRGLQDVTSEAIELNQDTLPVEDNVDILREELRKLEDSNIN